MKKFFKWAGIIIGILLLLMILAVVSLVTLVNPNRFKTAITERVSAMTGRVLTIDGDLSWSVFPNIGLKVDHLVLHNPPQFKEKNFAVIDHATVMVKLFPLFKHKVESSGITLDGMKLHLVKDAKGNDNWHLIPVKVEDKVVQSTVEKRVQKAPLLIAIAGVHVTNASITYVDEQKNQSAEIKNFELHAKDISLLNPFPVTSRFDYQLQNPSMKGQVSLKSDVALNLAAQVFAFKNLDLNVQNEKYQVNLRGDMTADLKRETLQWTNFQGNTGKLKFSGNLSGSDIVRAPQFKGHFTLNPFDMREWLKDAGFDIGNLQVLNPVSGAFDLTANNKGVNLQGKLQAAALQMNHLQFTNLTIPTHYQNGILNLSPIKADFYRGTMEGSVKLEGTKAALQTSFQHFEAALLLKDLLGEKGKLKFSGTGNLNISATTDIQQDALKNLNGKGQFGFDNGVLQGIDIPNLINSAYAIVKKTPLQESNRGQTDFGKMTGTFSIQNGIVTNNDLLLSAPQFTTNGNGTIDLPQQQIRYHLKTLLNKASIEDKDTMLNLYGVSIPILISGSLQNPRIGLDGEEVAKLLAGVQVKKVEMQIKDKLKGKKASELLNSLFGH